MLKYRKASVATALLAGALAAIGSGYAEVELTSVENFSTGFEQSEGYSEGLLQSDSNWLISGSELPLIGSFGYNSTFGVELDFDTKLAIDFFSSETAPVGWVDFYVKPGFADSSALPTSFSAGKAALTGFVKVGATGEVYALHGDGFGNGAWMGTGYYIPLTDAIASDWLRMTYRLDYGTQRWDLYLDDSLQMIDLGFIDANAPPLSGFSIEGSTEGETYFDQFEAGFTNPLFADADNDGIPDDYEQAQSMDQYGNDREGDADNDSLDNIFEYMSGLLAGNPDSDGDGVHDGAEIASGANPLVADAYALNVVPYVEDFESHAAGSIDGQGLWQVYGGQAVVQSGAAFEGIQALRFEAGDTPLELSNAFDGSASLTTWVDFRIQPIRFNEDAELPEDTIDEITSVVFYFIDENRVAVFDGDGSGNGVWHSYSHAASESDWQRVTILKDYLKQTFGLWINGALVAEDMGFAHKQPYFNRFSLKQGEKEAAYMDDLKVSFQKPAGLDTDGDGLADEIEDANGNGIVDLGETDPLVADTDGDGITDDAELRLKLWLSDEGIVLDGDGRVEAWEDQSGYGNNAAQTDTALRPALLDGDVHFDGTTYLEGVSNYNASEGDYTIVVVHRKTAGVDYTSPFSYSHQSNEKGAPLLCWRGASELGVGSVGTGNGEDGLYVDVGPVHADDYSVTSVRRTGGDAGGVGGQLSVRSISAAGVQYSGAGVQDWVSKSTQGYYVGRKSASWGSSELFAGEVAEVLVYNRSLNDEQLLLLEQSLSERHGLKTDLDGNGIADDWEYGYFGEFGVDPNADPDGDGLNTLREFRLGYDPTLAEDLGPILSQESLRLWLDASAGIEMDASTGLVSLWLDNSGWENNAYQNDVSKQPVWVESAVNGNGAMRFDGSDDSLNGIANINLGQGAPYTLFVVHKKSGGDDKGAPIGFNTDTSKSGPALRWGPQAGDLGVHDDSGSGEGVYLPLGETSQDRYFLTTVIRDINELGEAVLSLDAIGYTGSFEVEGVQTWTEDTTTSYIIGKDKTNDGQTLNGEVAEVILFNKALDNNSLVVIKEALKERYGISLDIDGDGLLNSEEDVNLNSVVDPGESDPYLEDSDGDGIPDFLDVVWEADPATDSAALTTQADGSKAVRFGFEAEEGFIPGELGGQLGWEASRSMKVDGSVGAEGTSQSLLSLSHNYAEQYAYAKRYLGAPGEETVWVTFKAKLRSVDLLSLEAVDPTVGAVFAVDNANRLAAFDAVASDWLISEIEIDGESWVRYDVELDYAKKEWRLCVEGVPVFTSVPFVDPTRDALSRFELLQQGGVDTLSWIDEIVIQNVEPQGLDFDEDGLDNYTERELGTDPNLEDTDADTLPDAWEVQYGLDPLDASDASANPDGDYIENAYEFTLGTDPTVYDSDSDGVGDGYSVPGMVKMETWLGEGTRLGNMIANTTFPEAPDSTVWLEQLESSRDVGDNFGSRVRGYIVPDETREYTIHLIGDNETQFWLSSDESAFNKVLMANVTTFTGWNEWDKFPTQTSETVTLQAGVAYYFEILHKEGEGSDYFRVAWNQTDGSLAIIPAANLKTWKPDFEDQDDDGLQDSWELANGLDPSDNGSVDKGQGGYGDYDQDGASNHEEKLMGTDPFLADTDGDSFNDWIEENYMSTSPIVADVSSNFEVSQDWQVQDMVTSTSSVILQDLNDDSKLHMFASGEGIIDTASDSMGFFYRTVSGDFSVTISYDQLEQFLTDGRMSLMARESLEPNGRYVSIFKVRRLFSFDLLTRLTDGQNAIKSDILDVSPPYDKAWIRLTREGSTFTAEVSSDNVTWKLIGVESASLPHTLYLGFSLYSKSKMNYTTAIADVIEWKTDSDQDGIWDADEALYGTSPTEADTDGDGYSDYDEVNDFLSDPLLADLYPAQVVEQKNGSEAVASLGDWIQDEGTIYVASGRGAVEYDLVMPQDAIYRLVVTAQNRTNQTRYEQYSIKVEVDGVYIGRLGLDDIEESSGSDGILTPWLTAGVHRVRFFIENTYTHRILQINQIEAQFIGGADENLNGSPDWMDSRLLANNSVKNLLTDGSITESPVSPFCLEGHSRYLPFSQASNSSLELKGLPEYGFYTDVALDATSETGVDLIFENGGHSATGSVRWSATDVLTSEDLIIRKGDSLLLTALDADDPSDQSISISVNGGAVQTGTESIGVQQLFDTAGMYSVSASVGSVSAVMQVTVVEAELGEPVEALNNSIKNWVPDVLPPDVYIQGDNQLNLTEVSASSTRLFTMVSPDSEPRYIAARVSEGGAVIDNLVVTGYELSSNSQTRVEVVETYDDGAVLVETDIVFDHIPDDLIVEARIFIAGVTFADGSIVKVLTADDFDELGRATLQFIMPFEASGSICHRLHIYQGEEYIGQF